MNKLINGVCLAFIALLVVAFSVIILYNTEWTFSDDFIFVKTTALGKHLYPILVFGRFYPLGFFDFNILNYIPGGRSVEAHFLLVVINWLALSGLFVALLAKIAKIYSTKQNQYLMILFFFLVFVFGTRVNNIFMYIYYTERMLLIFLSLFIWFYLNALQFDKTKDYILALLFACLATYYKEIVFQIFITIALLPLIFNYKNLSKKQKYFYCGLIANSLIFLSAYWLYIMNFNGPIYNAPMLEMSSYAVFFLIKSQNPIVYLLSAVCVYRAFAILFLKSREHLVFDSFLFASFLYVTSCFVLHLGYAMILPPMYFLLSIAFFYYSLKIKNFVILACFLSALAFSYKDAGTAFFNNIDEVYKLRNGSIKKIKFLLLPSNRDKKLFIYNKYEQGTNEYLNFEGGQYNLNVFAKAHKNGKEFNFEYKKTLPKVFGKDEIWLISKYLVGDEVKELDNKYIISSCPKGDEYLGWNNISKFPRIYNCGDLWSMFLFLGDGK